MGVCTSALCCVCMCVQGMCVHVCMHVGALCVCVCARVRLCVCVCQEGRVLSQLLAHPVWAFGILSPQSTLLRWPPSWPPAVHHQSSHVSAALRHAHRGHRDTRRRGSSGREGGSPTQPIPLATGGNSGQSRGPRAGPALCPRRPPISKIQFRCTHRGPLPAPPPVAVTKRDSLLCKA